MVSLKTRTFSVGHLQCKGVRKVPVVESRTVKQASC